MEEVWTDIEGYENLYAISSKGRCWSYKTNKLLKESINNDGYLRFSLFKNGKHKRYLAHRLVAKSFVANPNQYPEINHINENIKDNCVENLEWCTHKQNINYGSRNKKVSLALKNNQNSAKRVQNIDTLKIYDSLTKAEKETGIDLSQISLCCKNKAKTAGGYHWRYVEKGE